MMRKNLVSTIPAWVLLLTFGLLPGCQGDLKVTGDGEQPKEKLEIVGEPPKVVVEEEVYDFGSMEVEQTLSHEFVVKNEGPGVLKLKKDRSTCKCTMSDFEETELQAGESTTIRLEWIAKAIDAAFSQAAYIKTNDPEKEELELKIVGRVDQTFDVSPAGAWTLGEMNAKNQTEFSGTISSRILNEFSIKQIDAANPLVQVESRPLTAEELKEMEAKHGFHLSGKVDPGAPIGSFSDQVKVILDVKGEEKVATLNLEGYYAGPMQIIGPTGWVASEMTMMLGRFPASVGKEVTLSIFLRDNTGDPLKVTSVQCEPRFLQAELVQDEKFKANNRERYNLKLSVPAGSPPLVYEKPDYATITIETDNPLVSKMVIQVTMIAY